MLLMFAPLFVISAGIWTALDAARRRQNWFAWGVAVSVTGIALIAWLVVRRRFAPAFEPRGAAGSLALVTGLLFMVCLDLLLIRAATSLIRVAKVEGPAMSPTLNDGDRLLVDMSVYRRRDPRRGEIVMLLYPLRPERQFVMRVVAEEGDVLRIVDGEVFVDDVRVNDEYVVDRYRSRDHFGPVVVPEGYYFVLGDRRDNSSDSRHWGHVPRKYIVGRVAYRWWPLSAAGSPR